MEWKHLLCIFRCVEVATGTLEEGFEATDELCLAAGCYDVSVGGGSFITEVSFSFGNLSLVEAGDYLNVSVGGADCAVLGCMDPDATNYNADATEDNGSCEYSCEYFGQTTINCDGGSFQTEVSWTITSCDGATVILSVELLMQNVLMLIYQLVTW